MKKLIYILAVLVAFYSCNSEKANDCFQTTGSMVSEVITVTDFSEIEVNEGVTLYISQGITNSVAIETGENLLNDVEAYVENGRLIVNDNNSCNYVRDYGVTKVYVTATNITKIINNSQFNVYGENTLYFPELELVSENYDSDGLAVGSFYLDVVANNLRCTFNDWSSAFISGTTTNLTVNFYSGDSRFEGADLIAQNVSVYHRSSNDIIVYPVQSLSAELVSTGNVIVKNTPLEISILTPYIGRVIFEDQ